VNDVKLTIAKTTVHLLDDCVAKFGTWRFDAINIPLLLTGLMEDDKSILKEYLLRMDAEQVDFDAFLPGYCDDHQRKLRIKDDEEYDDLTQEEAAMIMPNYHVPDSEYDEMEEDESESEDDDFDSDDWEEDIVEGEDDNEIFVNQEFEEADEGDEQQETAEDEVEDYECETEVKKDEEIGKKDDNLGGEVLNKSNELPHVGGAKYILMTVKENKTVLCEVFETDPTKSQDKKAVSNSNNSSVKKAKPQYKSEHISDCIFIEDNGREHYYPASNEFMKIVTTVAEMSNKYGFTEVKPIHLTMALFKVDADLMKEFFADLEISYSEAKKYFTSWSILNNGIIPFDLQGFVYCINDRVDVSKPCEILMRDEEVKRIWNVCHKKTKRNSILVGEAGVGKSAIIEKITYEIVSGNCPKKFKGFQVLGLDVNSLIAGTMYRGESEERAKNLIDFLQNQNDIILYIDEIHTIMGAGACSDGEMDLANALKPILARGEAVVIGATTEEEYEESFARDAALSRRFEKIVIEEPESHEVYPMIVNKVKALSDFHKVSISKSMVEYAIMISHCFNSERRNPDRTLDAIDNSMVSAELSGRKRVTKKDILSTYGVSFKRFEKMSFESKMEIAYHEMGHYVYMKMSKYLSDVRLLAVSIMPAEWYLGITCYEYRRDVIPHSNMDYYIDNMAESLAGRVSEKMYTSDITDGARQDLNKVTEYAHAMVSKSGIAVDGKERNYVFLNTDEQPMYSQDTINQLNQEVKKVTDMAYARAEEVIHSHKDLIEALVSSIMEKHIMSESQLDAICQKFKKSTT